MEPLQFLTAVLPSSGFYCVAELTQKKEHVFVDRIDAVAEQATKFSEAGLDAYYALASFKEKGERKATNAQQMRCLFMDIDVGKAGTYESKQAAAAALDQFLQDSDLSKLGNPWVVTSGGGLHVYWPLDRDVTIKEWKPLAENLKKLGKKYDFKMDMAVTADAARVLRVPSTLNYKYEKPRRVRLVAQGGTFSFESLRDALREKLNGHATVEEPSFELPGTRPKLPLTATGVKLFENSNTSFKRILESDCKQIKHYVENATQDGMEPLWRGWLSIAQKCSDGEEFTQYLTQLHPYDDERMHIKLREIKGPYPCGKFESENPGGCEGCPHQGKITNPLALGREIAVTTEAAEIVLPAEDIEAPQIQIQRPTPPRGFSYGAKGGIFREKKTKDEEGKDLVVQSMVLPYDLFVIDILRIETEHQVQMLALKPEGPVNIIIPQRAVVSNVDTVKSLAEQNIVASFGSGNDKNLFDYVRGAVEEASMRKPPVKVPPSYGWQEDNTFVFNEKVYSANKPPRNLPMPNLVNINAATRPTGTLDNWKTAVQVLIQRQMYDTLGLMCVGGGAPLMKFMQGFRGMTFHVGSTESGTGKSLSLVFAASLWGAPTEFRTSKKTSDVAMINRFGMLNSLPLICDEITDKNRKDFEWFPGFLLDVSDGVGKERMEGGVNRERVNTTRWASLALLSSNTHVMDFLTGARKHSSEGEIRRLLEYTANEKIVWNPGELDKIQLIQTNYAVFAPKFVQWLVDHQDLVEQVCRTIYERVKSEFGFADDERFWRAGCAACIAFAVLCGKKYANIIDLPIEGIKEFYKSLVRKARGDIKSSYRTAEDILNAYTREHFGKFVIVRSLEGALTSAFGDSRAIDESTTRSEIMGRIERNITPGYIDYFIEEGLLKTYCSSMSFGYADFKKQMEKTFTVKYGQKDMLAKTRGPQMRANVIKIRRRDEPDIEDDLPVE
jgi:hypothetical protein